MAENKAGKKRFNHHVDFVTKYPLIHLPGMHHADKKLDDFVEEMLEKIPKQPEQPAEAPQAVEAVAEENQAKAEIPETPKAEEIVEALQAVVDGEAPKPAAEGEVQAAIDVKVEEKPKKSHKSKSKHRKKTHKSAPKIDDDLVDDGEDEPPSTELDEPEAVPKRKFSTVVHEPYEEETFRIFNAKNNLWFSGNLRDQTAIEGTTIKLLCAVSGPTPIIKWLKNGKPVAWGNNMRNMTGDGLGLVIIDKIAKNDAGVYTCTAKNQSNEVSTEAVIKVIPKSSVPRSDTSKPFFSRVLGEFYHITEDDLILDAHVRAVPEPTVVWLKDGVEINATTDKRFDFTTDHDGGYQFRIHKPNSTDSALYACEAVNSEGKAKVTHKVAFTELERHTHPQFVYHKESFWQPTLRMSIEPEPVKESSVPPTDRLIQTATKIVQAAGQSESGRVDVPVSQGSGSSGNQESGNGGDGSGGAPAGGAGSGGDGNEEGEGYNNGAKDAPDDGAEEEEKEKKPERRPKSSRRKRYEGPVEPILIRDSVN